MPAVELAVAVVAAHAEPPAASEAVQTAVISAPPEPAPAEPEEPAPAVETAGPSTAIEVEPPAAAPPAVAEAARAKPQDPRLAEAVTLSAAALHHFLKDDHVKAKAVVERALELDPGNRRAIELLKILRVLG